MTLPFSLPYPTPADGNPSPVDCIEFVQDIRRKQNTDNLSQIDLTKAEGVDRLLEIALNNRKAIEFCAISLHKISDPPVIPETEEEFQLILNPEVKRFADEVSQIPSFAKLGGKEQEKLLGDLRYTIREGDKPTSPLLAALVGGATTGGGLATFRGLQFFVVFNGERALGYLLEEAKWYGGAAVVGALLAGLGMDAYHKMNSGVEKRNILEAYLTQIDDAKKAHFHQLESAFAHCLYQNPDAIDTEKLALALANEKFHDILFEDGMAWHFADMIDHYEQMNLEPLPLINDRGPAEEKRRAKNRVQCGDQLAEIKKTLLGAPAESADVVAAL